MKQKQSVNVVISKYTYVITHCFFLRFSIKINPRNGLVDLQRQHECHQTTGADVVAAQVKSDQSDGLGNELGQRYSSYETGTRSMSTHCITVAV